MYMTIFDAAASAYRITLKPVDADATQTGYRISAVDFACVMERFRDFWHILRVVAMKAEDACAAERQMRRIISGPLITEEFSTSARQRTDLRYSDLRVQTIHQVCPLRRAEELELSSSSASTRY